MHACTMQSAASSAGVAAGRPPGSDTTNWLRRHQRAGDSPREVHMALTQAFATGAGAGVAAGLAAGCALAAGVGACVRGGGGGKARGITHLTDPALPAPSAGTPPRAAAAGSTSGAAGERTPERGPGRYRLGVTIGKFYPYHRGHDRLISRAEAQCDHLVVLGASILTVHRPLQSTRTRCICLADHAGLRSGRQTARPDQCRDPGGLDQAAPPAGRGPALRRRSAPSQRPDTCWGCSTVVHVRA